MIVRAKKQCGTSLHRLEHPDFFGTLVRHHFNLAFALKLNFPVQFYISCFYAN